MQKGHDLRSRANSVGGELAAAGTGGNAIFGRPCHSLAVIGVCGHIRKGAGRGDCGKAAYALRLRQAPPRAVVVSRISSTLFPKTLTLLYGQKTEKLRT